MTHDAFYDLMAMLDSPALAVTTQADGRPAGCLVGFATQTSVQPPSFMIGLARGSETAEVAARSEYLAVHVLPQGQQPLAELLGGPASGADKFSRCSWRAGLCGMPILDESAAWFVGRTVSRSDVGDYVAYLLEPVSAWAPENPQELLYRFDLDFDIDAPDDGGDVPGGHQAPNAFHERQRLDPRRRYGVPRFTLDFP